MAFNNKQTSCSLINGDSTVSAEQTVGEMVDYTKLYFNHEETLMQDSQYPDFEKHKMAHDSFLIRVDRLDQD